MLNISVASIWSNSDHCVMVNIRGAFDWVGLRTEKGAFSWKNAPFCFNRFVA
jgi:hypothetical protein